jgi:thioredoxin 1
MKQLLYFSAPWCGPCKTLAPLMEELAQTYPIRKINVDNERDIVHEYNITSVPTTILLVDGKEAERKVGVQSKAYYIQLLK